jgi:uncharacterized protein with NRDE domain
VVWHGIRTIINYSAMCLIVFAYRPNPAWRLILAANRDEFYARPTASLSYWQDAPHVLAGRDLSGGGTWLGITRAGKFAAVTNYRDPDAMRADAPSRGRLTADFLRGEDAPRIFLEELVRRADRFNPFSLVVGDTRGFYYFSNREHLVRELHPGVYGLSNHLLDTPWPKVKHAKRRLSKLIEKNRVQLRQILALLADNTKPPDEDLPDTGVGLERERCLSPIFISGQDYGTRSSAAMLIGEDGYVSVAERDTVDEGTRSYHWRLED